MLTIEKKSLKEGRQVDTLHVDTLIRNYKQERWVHNSERLGKEDTLSVWYSIEELEEFFAKVKDYGADGMRFYFGAYPNNFERKKGEDGRQTIVMVATKRKETETSCTDKDLYVSAENGTQILAYNLGGYCPPYNCPGGGRGGVGGGDDEGWGVGITIVDRGDKGLVVL